MENIDMMELYVASKKRTSSKIRTVCLVLSDKRAFFLISCVFLIFYFQIAGSHFVSDFVCLFTASVHDRLRYLEPEVPL